MTAGNEPDEEALQAIAADAASIAPDVIPNDPLLVSGFYHLKSATGSTKGANVINVWDDFRGAGVRVALIDDGFEYTHPDLAANYDTALDYDARDGDFDAYTSDPADAHGTATAGTIAAAAGNGIGGAGVAPEATIVGLRIGFGANGSLDQVIDAFDHATAVDVINNSWAFDGVFPDDFGAGIVQPVVENGRGGLGTVVVFSAGNARTLDDNVNYHGFQNYRGVITVAATDNAGNIASFSTPGDAILVAAPGVSIQTTDRVGAAGFSSGDFATLSGTSFSAPIVSGIAALMLEANPDLGWRDVQEILASTAIQTGAAPGWGYNHTGNWNGGAMHVSSDFGFGLVDALAAVRVAESWRETSTAANEMVAQSSSGHISAAIPDPGTLQRTLVLGGGIRIDHVEIDVSVSHPEISDLRITLTSPAGTQSVLFDTPVTSLSDISWTFSSTHFWGELSTGTWMLAVQDTINQPGTADAGTLTDWSLRAYGDPAGNDVYVYTDEFGALAASDPSRLTLNDAGGTDDINTAALASATSLDLRPGHTSVIDGQSVTLGAGTTIENADTGDGNDTLIGNDAANSLRGWRGDDTLDGGAGADTLVGGPGNDTYVVDPSDTVIEDANAGTDTIQASFTYSIAATPDLENITLTGSAPANATGNAADNVLLGNSAPNVLTGGLGNDTYGIDAADTIVENANEGIDTVLSPITYSLVGTNLENITLIGTDPVSAIGNDADNVLLGNGADNVLTGGLGSDTYGVDNATDTVVESAGQGTDTVLASITYSIASLPNLENVTLVGNAAIDATGNSGDNVLTGNSAANVLTGGAGNDTYYVGTGDSVVEAPGAGTDTVYSDATYTLDADVENLTLIGTAAINGTGNSLNNVLIGNSGNNTLNGGAGVDTMIGGLGNDSYVVNSLTDTIIENPGEGSDTVRSTITWSIASTPTLENITLIGSTTINATGNSGDNILTGNAGANVLTGGAGNDTYVVDAADTVVENANEGTDTVQSTVSWSIAAMPNLENVTLTGSAPVNATGNDGSNVLTGNTGNNVLDGGGGIDTLMGGVGNDTYVVDSTTDTITENPNQGTDTVQASVTYSIAALPNVENVTLTGTGSINATGNAVNNVLTGNSGDNVLDGGAGVDTLIGGSGNDTYVVDSTTDTITENAGEGTDTVQSSVTYSLAALPNVENVTLTGSALIDATGNDGNNVLTGNSADNVLDGGLGIDTLIGGAGNDFYLVDSTTDTITELPGGGIDTVESTVSYSIAGLPNLENVTLLGSAAINATGNGGGNILTGNDGDNILDGGGGLDTLVGGLGNDTYVVDSTTDTITENAGEGTDTVQSSVTYSIATSANLENITLTGAGAINATGNAGANVLTGNSSGNTLNGGAGNDTYVFNVGFGHDTVIDHDATAGNQDTVHFGSGITPASVAVSRTGMNLVLTRSADMVTVQNWFASDADKIERVDFADSATVWDVPTLQAMAGGNSPPVNTVPGAQSALEDAAKVISGISVADADGNPLTMTLTMTNGTVSVNAGVSGGAAVSGNGTATITLTGSQTAINATLADATGVTYNPASNFNGGATLTVVSDDGTASDTDLVTVNVAAVNDAPAFVKGADQTVSEDAPAQSITGWATGITPGPPDESGQTLAFNVTGNTNPGLFAVAPAISAGGTLTYTPAANANGAALLTVTIADSGGTANGGVDTSGPQTFSININAVNDPPVNTVPGPQGVNEDTNLTVMGVSVSDVEATTVQVTVSAGNGALSLSQTTGLSFSAGDGTGDATMTFSGVQANVDAALNNLVYRGSLNYNGPDTITVLTSDLGASGSGGTLTDTDTISITVNPVNDAPTVAIPIPDQGATVSTTFNYTVPANSFADVDAGDTLSYGAARADGSALPGWLTFTAATRTFSGTPAGGDAGIISVKVTATDTQSASAFDVFDLSVGGTFNGTSGADTLNGTAGNDTLNGLAGNDTLNGLDGNDTLTGGAGIDTMNGGNGDDTFVIAGVDGTNYDIVNGDAGFDTILGGAGNDTIRLYQVSGVEQVDGGAGTNVIASRVGAATILDFSGTTLLNIAQINGDTGPDTITGSAGNDVIMGGVGSDILSGGAGDDTFLVNGTDGTSYDIVNGGAGFDVILGGAGNDTIRLYQVSGVERIDGGAGTNVIASRVGAATTLDFSATELLNIAQINGDSGPDTITGSAGNDVISGGAGNDTLTGMDGNDTLTGGTGIDTLNGGNGNDTFLITGVDGTNYDIVNGGADFDTILGGAGDDTIRLFQVNGIEQIDGGAGTNVIAARVGTATTLDFSATTLLNIAQINGDTGADTITGSAGNDVIMGGLGSDTLNGGAGDDTFLFSGTDGTNYDIVNGGAGFDVILGGAGDDTIRLFQVSGVEQIDGGAGTNVIAARVGAATTLDFSATTLLNIAQINGDTGADTITGSAGNDVISGGAGNDTLNGMDGNDTLTGGTGIDTLNGGTGDDTFLISGVDGTNYDIVNGGADFDTILGGAGDDTIRLFQASGVEQIDGGAGTNVIAARVGAATTLDFSATALLNIAQINGDTGADTITGSAGNDVISGGGGNDTLNGSAGSDTLTGGAGNDTFVFQPGQAQGDTVLDFTGNGIPGGDLLRFSGFGAGATLAQSGTTDFWIISYGAQSETIRLTGITTLTAGDYQFV